MTSSLLWFTTRGAGIVSLCLLGAVAVLGLLGASGWQRAAWPRFLTTTLHRNLSLLAVCFLALHVVTAIVDPFTALGIRAALIPWGASYRPLWLGIGVVSLYLMAALIATSLLRRFIGYRVWRLIHWAAYAAFPLAVVHSLGSGSDTWFWWMDTVYALIGGSVVAVFALRVWRRRRRIKLPEAPAGAPEWTRLEEIG